MRVEKVLLDNYHDCGPRRGDQRRDDLHLQSVDVAM